MDKILYFYAPKIIGGREAISSVGGLGAETVDSAIKLDRIRVRRFGEDIAVEGYVVYPEGIAESGKLKVESGRLSFRAKSRNLLVLPFRPFANFWFSRFDGCDVSAFQCRNTSRNAALLPPSPWTGRGSG